VIGGVLLGKSGGIVEKLLKVCFWERQQLLEL
jgi:hypothetical protein